MNILLRRRRLGNGSCRGIAAASTTGLSVVRNDQPISSEIGYVFRWGCTSNVPDGAVVVNTAAAIHWCSDKRQGRIDMQAAGVSVPHTWGDSDSWLQSVMANGNLGRSSVVVRPKTHAQGRNLLVIREELTAQEKANAVDTFAAQHGELYISELINKVSEYRVAVIQGRVAWVAKKTPGNPEDVAWNVARGGRFDNVRWSDWPMAVVNEAIKAANVSGTDFCGVDVMVDADGKAFVLEINSAPSQTSPYRQSSLAKCFDYIVTNGKAHFPADTFRSWKSAIHPSLMKD